MKAISFFCTLATFAGMLTSAVGAPQGLSVDNLSDYVNFSRLGGQTAPATPLVIDASKSAEILKALYESKTEEAVRDAAAHLVELVPSFLKTDPIERAAYQQEVNLVQMLKVYELADPVLSEIDAGDTTGLEKKVVAAAVAEMLGELPVAATGYREVLEEEPLRHGVRARLAMLLVEHEGGEAAAAALEGIDPEAMVPLGQTLANKIQSINENEYERRLDYVELLAAFFEQADPAVYIPSDWLLNLLDHSIGQGNWGNTIRFADLYTSNSYSVGYNNPEQEARSREVEERRRVIHDRLCRAFLKLPQFANLGFQRLSGLATKDEGEDLGPYESIAQDLLLKMGPAPERPADLAANPSTYRTNFREDWVPFLSPAEFLLKAAVEDGDYGLLQDQVIPKLEGEGKKATVDFLKGMIDLAAASEEAFVSKAVALVRADYDGIELGNLMRRVVELHESRASSQDLGPILMAYFEGLRFRPYQSSSFVVNYGKASAGKGADVFSKFIDDSAVAMLGPVEGHAELIKNHFNPNRYDLRSSGNAVRNYVAFLAHMIQSPSMAAVPLKKAFAMELVHPNDYQLRNPISNNLRYYRFRDDVQGVYKYLVDMGMLGDLDTIEFYPMNNITRGTLFGNMLYNLCRVDSDDKERVMAPITAHPEETFGKAMLLVASKTSSSSSAQRNAITAALEPYMDAILKLPEERQKDFLFWYSQMISNNSLSSTLKRTAPKVAAWYEPWRQSGGANQMMASNRNTSVGVIATVEAFLKVEERQQLDQQSGLDYVASQVARQFTAESSVAEVEAFVRHFVKLARQPLTHQPGVAQVPNIGALMVNLLNQDRSLGSLGMVTHLLKLGDDPEANGPLPPSILGGVRNALSGESFEDPATAAKALTQKSQGAYDDRLTPFFAERFAALQASRRDAIRAWASGQKGAPLAEGWRDAVALTKNSGAESQSRWVKRVTDEQRSLAQRVQTASVIAPLAVRAGASLVVAGCIDAYAAVWAQSSEKKREGNSVPVVPGPAVSSEAASALLASLIDVGVENQAAVAQTRAFLEIWIPHLADTLMGTDLVKRVLSLPEAYQVDRGAWLAQLPQAIQRQPGFLTMLMQESAPEEAVAGLSWSLVAMPPVTQKNQRSQRQIRYVNGERQVHYMNQGGSSQLNLGPDQMNATLWGKLQALLKVIEDPGQRYFAEMLVGALPDANGAMEGVPSRSDRLKSLTERYDREVFTSPYLAEHTVSWLCALNGKVAANTGEAVAHFGDQISYRSLAEWYDGSLRSSRQGLLNHYIDDASKNHPAAFARLLEAMLERADPNNGEAQQLLETYCKGFPKSILQGAELMEPEKARTYLPLLRRLTSMARRTHWNGRDECISGNFAMHILANDAKGYQEWMLGLDLDTRMYVFTETNVDQVVYLLRDGLNGAGVSQERRFEILNGLFTGRGSEELLFAGNNISFGSRSNDNSVFERMIGLSVLKKEEILQHGPAWAEANPRGGSAYGELAQYQAEAGQTDEAILNYLQAVVHTPLNNRTGYGRFHLEKTKLLLQEGRIDAAMNWLEFLERGRLDDRSAEAYDDIIRQTRFQYLLAPDRLDYQLASLRARLGQDASDYAGWRDLAEVVAALGHQRMEASDYFRGLAFLKLSYYILHRLKRVDPEFDEELLEGTSTELVRGLTALGLGGKKRYLISKRSYWDYHYHPGGISSPDWRALAYRRDRSWMKGRAPLGYGDGDETTVLNYGKDKENKPITGYFRMIFELEDPSAFEELTLGVLHDDGMVAYLNGRPLIRNNMPSSGVGPETLAPESRGSSEENDYWTAQIKGADLQAGENVMAVEVHQNDTDSSDFGFDLELYSGAINAPEIVKEVESGSTMKLLKAWGERLPSNVVEMAKGL